jgi:SpoVK/Ycf46/Vps4 family AAA+-type ATPase
MLLYGPPGTGKTTIAENLAIELGFPIINISVSDFIVGGAAEIEARAKELFDVIAAQRGSVIFFDEIDQLLLDRDSARYSKQQDVFQFMTPGMLTKLNDLRAAERSIFIIATNYANRIDAAIKRPGRIDQAYLVLPPDRTARVGIMQRIIGKLPGTKALVDKLEEGDWQTLADDSIFLGFADIRSAIMRVLAGGSLEDTLALLRKELAEWRRTVSLAMYGARFSAAKENENPPEEEFVCLLAMALPPGSLAFKNAEPALTAAASWFASQSSSMQSAVDDVVPKLSLELRQHLAETLSKYKK